MKSLTFIFLVLLFFACEKNTSEEQVSTMETVETVETVETDTNDIDTDISITSNTSDLESLFLLQEGKVGLFEIGITVDKAEMIAIEYGNIEIQDVDRMIEGMPSPALELTINGTKALLLEMSEDDSVIYRIEIDVDIFKTENGICVGSSYQDLKTNYTFDEIHWGDAGQPVVIIEEDNFSFMLEQGDWWQMGEVTEEVPPETKVIKIILW